MQETISKSRGLIDKPLKGLFIEIKKLLSQPIKLSAKIFNNTTIVNETEIFITHIFFRVKLTKNYPFGILLISI